MTTTPPAPPPLSSDPTSEPPLSLTARTPEDLLAIVPVVLGFVPAESVVMLTFGAQRPFHARIDLPEAPTHALALWDELAAALLEPAVRHRADRIVVVLYTGDAGRAEAAWRRIRRLAGQHDLTVLEVLRVGHGRYHPMRGGSAAVREQGVPFDIGDHRFLVEAVVSGRVTHASRADLAATLVPDPEAVDRVAAHLRDLEPWQPVAPPPAAVLLAEGSWARDLVLAHALAGTDPTDEEVARLVRSMAALRVRDAAWSVIGREHGRAHRELWTRLLRRTPPSWTPPVATLLAFAAWQSGDGALAWCALDRCAEVDPDYSLAGLVSQVLSAAIAPTTWDTDFDWTAGLVG